MAESKAAGALAVPTDWERMTEKEKGAWLADRLRQVTNRTVYSWAGPWEERDDLDDDDCQYWDERQPEQQEEVGPHRRLVC